MSVINILHIVWDIGCVLALPTVIFSGFFLALSEETAPAWKRWIQLTLFITGLAWFCLILVLLMPTR